jgi:hypothetical protein
MHVNILFGLTASLQIQIMGCADCISLSRLRMPLPVVGWITWRKGRGVGGVPMNAYLLHIALQLFLDISLL